MLTCRQPATTARALLRTCRPMMSRSLPTRSGCTRSRLFLSTTSKQPVSTLSENYEPSAATASATASAIGGQEITTAKKESIYEYTPVTRHGHGDSVMIVNVGGKEFQTLRSTIQTSPVLCETIARAEANNELIINDKTGKATIFVDRDPTHFGLILTYLRNKTDGIAYNSKITTKTMQGITKVTNIKIAKNPEYLRLPTKDQELLQDLYVEAIHYGLVDLQSQLCHTSVWITIVSYLGGSSNPFQQATESLKVIRNTALALAGTSGIIAAVQSEIDWLHNLIFPGSSSKKGKDEKEQDDKKVGEPQLAG